MKKKWFKRKNYGYGWIPNTWQGWLVTIIAIVIIVMLSSRVDDAWTTKDMLFKFLIPFIATIASLILISYIKGEEPRWQWGGK